MSTQTHTHAHAALKHLCKKHATYKFSLQGGWLSKSNPYIYSIKDCLILPSPPLPPPLQLQQLVVAYKYIHRHTLINRILFLCVFLLICSLCVCAAFNTDRHEDQTRGISPKHAAAIRVGALQCLLFSFCSQQARLTARPPLGQPTCFISFLFDFCLFCSYFSCLVLPQTTLILY